MSTQAITASNICDVQLFDRNGWLMEHHLCYDHYEDLSRVLSRNINVLVATPLFQSEFRKFLPSGNTDTVDITIRIKDRIITVERMDSTRKRKTVDLSTLNNTSETEDINRIILLRANAVYRNCLRECPTHRQSDSLRGRASHYDDHSRRELSTSPRRDHDHSRRAHSTSPQPCHRDHDANVDTAEARLNLLRTSADRLRSESQSNPHLAPDLTRLEEQISQLERMLNITPATATSTVPQERMDALIDRLRAESQAVHNPPPVEIPPNPTLLNPLGTAPTETTPTPAQLTLSTETIPNPTLLDPIRTAPTESEPAQSTLSDDHFNTLMDLSDILSSQEHAGSTNFPDSPKNTFDTTIPLKTRNATFYQTYLLCDPTDIPNPWPIGERLFNGSRTDIIQADNICRAHAIRHFLLLNLACDFGAHEDPPAHFFERFNRFPEEDRNAIYTQLQYVLQRPSHEDNRDFAARLFHTTATGIDRNNAMIRVLLNRNAEYHRHLSRMRLDYIAREFENAYRRLQEENNRLRSTAST